MAFKWGKEFVFIALGLAFFVLLALLAGRTLYRMSAGGSIGLIEVQGMILEDRRIIMQLHKMNDHPMIRAIVISINSPGGTIASAQSISEEIKKIRRLGKPVVVSMSEVCASGGYYIACAADRIYANPGSITGSIGVILRYPEAGELMKKLGLNMEVVKSVPYKDIGDFSRKMNKSEKKIMQRMIDDLHAQFVEAVFDARGDKLAQALAAKQEKNLTDMLPEDIKKYLERLSDGRVFTGRQALQKGLIDKLGNLDDAVQTAAFLAKLKGKPRVLRDEGPSFLRRLMGSSQHHRKNVLGVLQGLKRGVQWDHLLKSIE
ncbi:signal peptide peptidase SppA [bacterium]|nr:signal peptide peptidase SppA [bacterium]